MLDYKKYESYRETEIPWIGQIPSQWQLVLLSQVVTQVKNKNTALLENNLLSLSYGRIKRKPIDSSGGLLPESFDGYNIIEENDIVLRLTDLQNDHTSLRVAISPEKGIITSAYTTMRPRNSSCAKYLFYLLHTFDIRKGFYGMGSGVRQGLNYDEVKRLQIPWPTVEEQTHISEYLDRETDKINTIISEAKASIEEYKTWKASIIYEAVTKGLDPSVEMKESGVAWIGSIPAQWSTCSLKRLTTKIGSGKTPLGGAEVYTTEGILFLRSQNVFNTGLEVGSAFYISEEINSTMENSQVQYQDVLLNITGGSIGRCCIYDLAGVRANVNQHVCILRTIKAKLLPGFLRYFWISSAGPIVVEQYQTGGNRPGLNFEQIGLTKIPYCDIETQQRIVDYLDNKCEEIDSLIREKEFLISDLESYKKSLIFEVVTGKRRVC